MKYVQYTWTGFYSEFASKLRMFEDDRQALIAKLQKVYETIGMQFPKLDTDGVPEDIDPFTVFALFNKGITDKNRIKITEGFASEFGVESPVPSDFTGIPVVNNLGATFYAFRNDPRRGVDDINRLWTTFTTALEYADNYGEKNKESFILAYDSILHQYGIKWNITIGLYWIRPYTFLNLDSRNRIFLKKSQNITAEINAKVQSFSVVPYAAEYLDLCTQVLNAMNQGNYEYKTFPELSAYAYAQTEYEEDDQYIHKPENKMQTIDTEQTFIKYSKESFLSDVYMDEKTYDTLTDVLRFKKNIILQGAPGVGKTFAAKRLAYSLIGAKDTSRVMMIQFHQSYSYEDFIEGYRPSRDTDGFELVDGVFYTFCKLAAENEDKDYFFIIDEINRGNLSKIFGELLMLIENDKRGSENKIRLLYSDELFYVPSNVYIIGMMNTADRSLAIFDYALRRRFAFFELKPAFDSEGFIKYQKSLRNSKFDLLIQAVKRLNEAIADDESLGDGFRIGYSYFCGMKPEDVTDMKLHTIVEYELVPLLQEYWFDEPTKVNEWTNILRKALQ